jgi:kinesin family protein 6/9
MQAVTNLAAINSQAEISPQQALAQCQAQLHDLKRELAMHDQLSGRGGQSYDAYTPSQRSELRARVSGYLEGDVDELEASTLRQIKESFEIFRELYREQAQQLKAANARADAAASAATSANFAAPPVAGGAGPAGAAVTVDAEANPDQPPVEVVEVGDALDGGASGFGCGVAPADAKPSDPQFASPGAGAKAAAGGGAAIPSAAGELLAASAAPVPPQVHFSEFKQGAGAELSALLLDNKSQLRERKASQRRYAMEVNAAKSEIDDVKAQLEIKKAARGPRPLVEAPGGGAAEVIDDEEFAMLAKLKQAKLKYRQAFDALTDERATVEYVSGTVEQCRSQLLQDFTTWLRTEHPESAASAAALMTAGGDGISAHVSGYGSGYGSGFGSGYGVGGTGGLGDGADAARSSTPFDQDEQFEKLEAQMALSHDPDSLPFFKAGKLATARSHKTGSVRTKPRPFQ